MRAPGATWDCSVGNGDLIEAEEKPAELCGGGLRGTAAQWPWAVRTWGEAATVVERRGAVPGREVREPVGLEWPWAEGLSPGSIGLLRGEQGVGAGCG